jgi:hypothetical protein
MRDLSQFDDQIERIREKLPLARAADPDFLVFGAKSHRYELKDPVSLDEVEAFEARCGITLPAAYVALVTRVGSGGPAHDGAGAGPFYGLYRFGTRTNELFGDGEKDLALPCRGSPDTDADAWEAMIEALEDEALNDAAWEAEAGRIYGGLMPLLHQGCAIYALLVLNGPHAGRIVNLDGDQNPPRFAFEDTVLDYYERWLDEVIGGLLQSSGSGWFGYGRGGDEPECLARLQAAQGEEETTEALSALARFSALSAPACAAIAAICEEGASAAGQQALRLLTRYDYDRALPFLRAAVDGEETLCRTALEAIRQGAPEHAADWLDAVVARLPGFEQNGSFWIAGALLEGADVERLQVFASASIGKTENIRRCALYYLGMSRHKAAFLEHFLDGLAAEEDSLVHTSLQSLAGLKDERVLPAYHAVGMRYVEDRHHIHINLEHRVKEWGYRSRKDFLRTYRPDAAEPAKRPFWMFWKR